jgi:DNA-binding transcriptional LysR family regulator
MEFGTIEAIISCVEAGLGVSLLPRGLLEDAERERRLSLHKLSAVEAQVEIFFIQLAADYSRISVMKTFCAICHWPSIFSSDS